MSNKKTAEQIDEQAAPATLETIAAMLGGLAGRIAAIEGGTSAPKATAKGKSDSPKVLSPVTTAKELLAPHQRVNAETGLAGGLAHPVRITDKGGKVTEIGKGRGAILAAREAVAAMIRADKVNPTIEAVS